MFKKIFLLPIWIAWMSLIKVRDPTEFSMTTYIETKPPILDWISSLVLWIFLLMCILGVGHEIFIYS